MKSLTFWKLLAIIGWLLAFFLLFMWLWFPDLEAKEITLTASWYSISSLHKDGQWSKTKGRCADGSIFKDDNFTCATRLFPLGSVIRITNSLNNKSVTVIVTDRIGKRFAKTRIDLSKKAFSTIANLKQGIISCKVERIK